MMLDKYIKRSGYFILLAFCFNIYACKDTSDESEGIYNQEDEKDSKIVQGKADVIENNQIWLEQEIKKERREITINYLSGEKRIRPRVMEVFLRHSDNLEYIVATEGEAIIEATKQLIVQKLEGGKLRAVVLSSGNINRIRSGELFALGFDKTDTEAAKIEILSEKPIFAPEEANEGLVIGEPLIF